MKTKQILTKIIALFSIFFFAFPVDCFAVDWFSLSNRFDVATTMSDVFKETMESDFGIDPDTTKKLMSNIDNIDQKVQTPEVSISFSPQNPKPGQKITAFAQPTYFNSSTENMYFTWLLRRASEKDNDDESDIEKYKVRAGQILASNDFDYEEESYAEDNDDDGYSAVYGGETQRGKNKFCFFFDKKDGEFYPDDSKGDNTDGFPCKHLFANGNIGDGEFKAEEEKYWHTNPKNPNTSGTGKPDEAVVAGLGQNQFSWIYQEGDEIALAVEGVSTIPTKESDSSYKVMWAFSGKGCSINDPYNGDDDFDDYANKHCFPRSFISPVEGGKNEKIEVNLFYLPENPVNDPTKSNINIFSVQAAAGDSSSQNLFYKWDVYTGSTTDGPWEKLVKDDIPGTSQTSGINTDKFQFILAFPNSPKFLKIKATVSENAYGGTRQGVSSVVVPLSADTDQIKIYSTFTSPELTFSNGIERCKESNTNCQVSPNEIITAEIPKKDFKDFSWAINGQPVSYAYLGEDFTTPTNTVSFPVNQKVGTQFALSLSAVNMETGEKLQLSRVFNVVDPVIKIFSLDEETCAPTLLGYFEDLDGNQFPDYDEKSYEALNYSTVKLGAYVLGTQVPPESISWYVPESSYNSSGIGETFSFETDDIGTTYTVTAATTYMQDIYTLKALDRFWGISYPDFYKKTISDTINLEVFDILNPENGEDIIFHEQQKKKPMASLINGLPAYFMFLFKIILTTALLIFLIMLFSSFSSQREN